MIYDVAIIGAGPAGSFAAYKLAKEKINGRPPKIIIFEASPTLIRKKVCGGEISAKVLKEIPELEQIIVGKTNLMLSFLNNKLRKTYNTDDYFVTRITPRPESIDAFLPQLIIKKHRNVKLYLNTRVLDVKNQNKNFAELVTNNGVYKAKLVIDASGITSTLNEKLAGGLPLKCRNKYYVAAIEFKPSDRDKKKILKFIKDKQNVRVDIFEKNYLGAYWIFYYEKVDLLNIGAGFLCRNHDEHKEEPVSRLYWYLSKFLKLKDFDKKRICAWIDPVELQPKLYADHILWFGDSAGMSNPFSGHGLDYMIAYLPQLAKTCVEALEKKDYSENILKKYQLLSWRLILNSYAKNAFIQKYADKKLKFSKFAKFVLKYF